MSQISARIPDDLVNELDKTAHRLKRSRADVVRQAIEYYLDDCQDLAEAIASLQDPADAVVDWETVKRDLLNTD